MKTLCDYLVASGCLVMLSPLILIFAIAIKLSGNGPVIYSQRRTGKNGKTFLIYKFRSMYHGSDEGFPLLSDKDDKRITPLGRFMRKHKFDEIPNFINVLKGEISIVGPRPEQNFFAEKIIERDQRYRNLQVIKPGITSWGQVKFGYAGNVDDMLTRMEYDLFYLNNRSMLFDLKIVFLTLGIILRGQGI